MTLMQLISAIESTKILISVRDANETELIKFYTGGQAQLSDTLKSRTVSTIKIENQTTIVVELSAAA